MSPYVMVVLIVLIATIGKVLSGRHAAHARTPGSDPQSIEALRAATDEIRQLKERVSVLERVVTDNHGSIGLDREIERLRDR